MKKKAGTAWKRAETCDGGSKDGMRDGGMGNGGKSDQDGGGKS